MHRLPRSSGKPSSGETAASFQRNVGLVLSKGHAAGQAGAIALCEVTVPAQNTVIQQVLDTTEPTHSHIREGVANVASVCLRIGYPTVASVPHSVINRYKRVLALPVETEFTFALVEKVQAFLAASAFVAAASATAAAIAAAPAAAPVKAEALKPERVRRIS
ncbi:hypothetical protein U0070_014059 [Myodes glareolus]|uniref:Large ribosomal subunit protein uL10 n=1 Tax=Myodes glareolus TaxID=447135 RepID=A0AAW0HLS0_MYOGA